MTFAATFAMSFSWLAMQEQRSGSNEIGGNRD
jgi:hypothetical protein